MDDHKSKIELQIDNFLLPFHKDLSNLAQDLRQYIKYLTQPKFELIGDSTLSVNIGYGFTEKAWDCFCAIIVYSKHINISFPSGAGLSDPDNLLIGTGIRVRHIKMYKLEDIKSPEIKKLLIEARNLALSKINKEERKNDEIVTIIKQIKGIKKRYGSKPS
jgi:hypothetical protein